MSTHETLGDADLGRPDERTRRPGVLLVLGPKGPACTAVPLVDGRLCLGRDLPAFADDERASRRHAELEWDGFRFHVRDLGSRNGTFVDGERIERHAGFAPRVVRFGRTLVLPLLDVTPYEGGSVTADGDVVRGPRLQRLEAIVREHGRRSERLLVVGESGVGKERFARLFHESGPHADGKFVALNCATIPEGVADRILFGARKGAYSGATDAEGYVQAADGGVLFLDELGELDLDVQAKLLRVLETGEVAAVGDTRVRRVRVRFVFATNRDLRAAMRADRFRADLYYRIAEAEAHVPPLRERPEEIPRLVERAVATVKPGLGATPPFVEAVLLRKWPGNVRELLQQARRAARAAMMAAADAVGPEHLDPAAGTDPKDDGVESSTLPSSGGSWSGPSPTKEAVEAALAQAAGNVSAAARSLGVHRKQLYRWMERHGIAPRAR